MSQVSFHCPNCSGPLTFDPQKQKFVCDYCLSEYDEATLLRMAAEEEAKKADSEKKDAPAEEAAGETTVYNCPNCGAELVSDGTTAATECYYCHNPVVLAGRLRDEFRPDWVLPFTVTHEEAKEKFLTWVGKKKFVPKGFFNEKQMDKLAGVYYPYWFADYKADAQFSGEGTIVSHTSTARENITMTQYYRVTRRADIDFRNVERSALEKADRKLADGVHPYRLEEKKPFSIGYLSGFLAEKRDIDKDGLAEGIETELRGYVEPMLTSGSKYSSLSGNTNVTFTGKQFTYGLLPSWVLTYQGSDKKTYSYVVNGQTGEACGKLPLDRGKLWRVSLLIGGIVSALLILGGWLIW